MPLNFKQRRKILQGANYLDLHPYRLHKEIIDEAGKVTLLLPKFTNKFSVKFLVPFIKSPDIKIKFDELGSASWLAIDGVKNVREIADELTAKFGDKIQPAHERLTKFLTGLYLQGSISFNEIKKEGE